MEDELIPGSYIKCKILGCLETSDDDGDDPKLIACPISKIDPTFKNINTITDLKQHTLDKLKYFFMHYKDLENKKVNVKNYINNESALQIYNDSVSNFFK
jgi:inorganic pyrophosphatase